MPGPGQVAAEAPTKLGEFLRDIIRLNPTKFPLLLSRRNRIQSSQRRCLRQRQDVALRNVFHIDDHVSPDGRVFEVLSEHCCQGWLEGYVLTGRHGMWSSYEGFAQIADSMLTQHAKWLKESRGAFLATAYCVLECVFVQPRLAAGS